MFWKPTQANINPAADLRYSMAADIRSNDKRTTPTLVEEVLLQRYVTLLLYFY
jgi:hypothetical protein